MSNIFDFVFLVNATTRIATGEVCPVCPVCQETREDCPLIMCPGVACKNIEIVSKIIDGKSSLSMRQNGRMVIMGSVMESAQAATNHSS